MERSHFIPFLHMHAEFSLFATMSYYSLMKVSSAGIVLSAPMLSGHLEEAVKIKDPHECTRSFK